MRVALPRLEILEPLEPFAGSSFVAFLGVDCPHLGLFRKYYWSQFLIDDPYLRVADLTLRIRRRLYAVPWPLAFPGEIWLT